MRDKVKRFISILMTALMLVNLMPVGALADGITSGGYQQQVAESTGNYTVYVYARFDGDPLPGVTLNASQWYTIGYIANVNLPSPGGISWGQYWYYNNNNYCGSTINSTSASGIIGGLVHQYNTSIVIKSDEWISANFKACPGADTYKEGTSEPTWHLDIIVDINKNPPVHNLVFKVNNSNGKQIGTPKKVTGRWTNPLSANKYYAGNPVPETIIDGGIKYQLKTKREGNPNLDTKIYFDEPIKNVEFYYKDMGPVVRNYTVNYYLKETTTKVAESITGTAPLGETVTPPTEVTGYTLVPGQETSLTIGDDENVLNLYYTPRTDLSYTVNYYWNGTTTKVADSKTITGQMFGEEVTESPIGADGYTPVSTGPKTITIGTGTNEINFYYYKNVTLTANSDTKTYDGQEQMVEPGYICSEKNVTFDNIAEPSGKGTDAGEYPVTFAKGTVGKVDTSKKYIVTVANPGTLTINKRIVVLTSGSGEKVYDGTALTNGTVTVGADGFADGEGATYDVTGSQTVVGESDNTFTYTLNEGTKADNYTTIEKNEGKLSINPVTDKVTVTITEKSGTATYDGKEHIVSGYESMTADNPLYDEDSVEENPTVMWAAKGTNVGEYPVGIVAGDFKNTNANFTNVEFVVVDGALEITPAPVTLQAPIASKTYDGEPLKAEDYVHSYVEGVNFADDFAAVILTGSQTLVGSSSSLITEVIPKEGKKLKNYKFTFLPGTLTVTDGTGDDPVKPENVVTKTHIPKDMGYNLGEPVTFTISVKNIYNTPKTITLTEKANVKFSNGEKVIVFNDVPAGETVTAEATYTITSADILEGVFHNTVTADFTGGGSWTAEDTVTTAELDTTLNVTKTSDVPEGQKAALGQTITYTIKVQNAGNVPYTNVVVEDPLTKLTATIETLPVGETRTFTTEYVVTEADVLKGSVLNTATAKGDKIKDPKSDEPKEPNGGDEVEIPTFAPITLKPKDVTATYNGAAITGKDVEITSGKLLEGHKLSAAVIGSGVNAGSYELTLDPEKIKIVDANNKDVSEMYARTILPGKLIINKRSVLITSPSATKTYDGSALTRPAVTITGDGFVPGELAKAEATGSITNVGSTPNAIRYTTTGAFNAANYSIALSVGTLTVTEKPKPEPRRTFNLTINYVYQNGKRAAASYNRGGLKNGETFDITSPVIAGYTASETVVSGTIYNRDIKVTVIYTADGVNLDDYGVPLGLGNITMNVGDCFE